MIVEIISKNERRGLFTVWVDQEAWRDIHRTIFGKSPTLPKEVQHLAELEAAVTAAEYSGARRYAVWRLARFSQSSHTLTTALARVLVSESCRQRVIEELTKMGFLNDQDYCKRVVASEKARGRGPAAARRKLQLKGIDEGLAEEALEGIDEESQQASIQRLLETKYARRDLEDYKERQKVIAALIRRGFDLNTIQFEVRASIMRLGKLT